MAKKTISPTKYQSDVSSFWLEERFYTTREKGMSSRSIDLLKMVSVQRSIANFVKILSKRDIPVIFNSKDVSYTDGKTKVILSADTSDGSFDPAVGLALHEASHLLYTDFNRVDKYGIDRSLSSIWGWANTKFPFDSELRKTMPVVDSIRQNPGIESCIVTKEDIFGFINWIEDRRIDAIVYSEAPGYRGYYDKLYAKYMFNPKIDKMLRSKSFRDEDMKSYTARIMSSLNPNSDPKALKALDSILKVIDLDNISRLTCTDDSILLALRVTDMVVEAIYTAQQEPQQSNPQPGSDHDRSQGQESDQSQDSKSSDSSSSEPKSESEEGDSDSEDDNEEFDSDNTDETDGDSDDSAGELSLGELLDAADLIQDIQRLTNGDVKKTKISSDVSDSVNTLATSSEYKVTHIDYNGAKVPVLACTISKRMLESVGSGKSSLKLRMFGRQNHDLSVAGLRMGTLLGHKLQVRDQVRTTEFTRLKSGKIDNRQLYQAGYGIDTIFSSMMVDKYIPSELNISIDASSSMSGDKWRSTQIAVLAIAKACSMVQNIRVKISYRYELAISEGSNAEDLVLVDAYDSNRDSIQHLSKCIEYLKPNNCTPDSLIIESQLVSRTITPSNPNLNSYFINFSDGGPNSDVRGVSYGGSRAHEHIKRTRQKIEALGVKVMSYYLTEAHGVDRSSDFENDWGAANSHFINITELNQLAKTINDMFLSKK